MSQGNPRAAPSLSILVPGTLVAGRFEVEALADWGGMGAVYRARDREDGGAVALKVLLPSADTERFARESRVLAELRHPAIVRYVADGKTLEGQPFLAMEWLSGVDLRHRLDAGPLPIADAVAVATCAASGLSALHARGLVHRDVNPRNLFLEEGRPDRVKVLDFGIARGPRPTLAVTLPGVRLGTPGYMAPEQARGGVDLGPATDVFALGCVLFECLTGRPAFLGDNVMALLAKVLLEEAPRVGAHVAVPEPLERLVAEMLAKAPEDRPRDGGVLADRLSVLTSSLGDALSLDALPPRSLGRLEQRLVCVVMAAAPPDRGLLARDGGTLASAGERAGISSPLARFGARAEWLADGSLVATLSADGDASDHAAHGARFALALRDLAPSTPIALAMGRGLVTGQHPVGEALDRAARLLAHARAVSSPSPVAPIHIDEVTAALLDARFDVAEDEKGVDERGALLRGTRESADVARTVLGRVTTCVGRERELLTLEAMWAECVEESVARAVLITGAAGLGKSRVRRELLRRLRRRGDRLEVLFGRADPMSAGAPFALLAQAVRGAAGIVDGEPVAVRRQKLLSRVSAVLPASADAARVAEFLGELVGAPFPEEQSVQLAAARQDPVLRGDQMRRAWEDWLAAEARAQPVLLVLEDLQWGDLPTMKAVDATLRNLRDQRVLVLSTARPEVHEIFPTLWEQRGVVDLRLTELTPKASERLVREVLGDAADAETVARIAAHGAGNPFCLEELIRAEAEGRPETLPATVLAVAHARLERLDPSARRVLRAASVFGQTFWGGAVQALVGGDHGAETREWLAYLVDREVISRRGRGFRGEEEYAFHNAVVREAAYATLLGDDRALGHRLAAAWLEEAGEPNALVLAEHLERGGLAERAVRGYRRAAEQALAGNDLEAVLLRAQKGLAHAQGEDLGALRLLSAEAHKWRGENPLAAEAAERAMEALPEGSAAWYAAAGELAAAVGKMGQRDRLLALRDRLLSLPQAKEALVAVARVATQLVLAGPLVAAEPLFLRLRGRPSADPAAAGWVLEAQAIRAGAADEPGQRVRLAEAAAESFEQAGDLRNACLQGVSVGFAMVEIGAYAAAARTLTDAIARGERLGLDNALATARAQLGRARAAAGALAEGRALVERAMTALRAQNNRRLLAIAHAYLAAIRLREGDAAAAESDARTSAELLADVPSLSCGALAVLARARLSAGRATAALDAAEAGLTALHVAGSSAVGEPLVRLAHVEALLACGRRDEAASAAREAVDRVAERARRIADADLARAHTNEMLENVRLRELARELA